MIQVRVRNKHQITLPAHIAASAHIKKDDMLEVAYYNGVVTLIPIVSQKRKVSAMAYAGIAEGVWGNSAVAIDNEQKKSRDSWER